MVKTRPDESAITDFMCSKYKIQIKPKWESNNPSDIKWHFRKQAKQW